MCLRAHDSFPFPSRFRGTRCTAPCTTFLSRNPLLPVHPAQPSTGPYVIYLSIRLCPPPPLTSPTTLLRFSSKRSSLGYVSGFNSGFAAVHARCHKGVKTPRCVSFGTAIRFRSVTTELVLAARGNGATREIVVTRSFTPLPPPGSESRFRSVEQPTRSPPSFLPRAAFYAPFRSSFATALHRSSLAWTRDPRS